MNIHTRPSKPKLIFLVKSVANWIVAAESRENVSVFYAYSNTQQLTFLIVWLLTKIKTNRQSWNTFLSVWYKIWQNLKWNSVGFFWPAFWIPSLRLGLTLLVLHHRSATRWHQRLDLTEAQAPPQFPISWSQTKHLSNQEVLSLLPYRKLTQPLQTSLDSWLKLLIYQPTPLLAALHQVLLFSQCLVTWVMLPLTIVATANNRW